MATIPNNINGVNVTFHANVNNNVVEGVITALQHCINPNIAPPHNLQSIHISSIFRPNTGPSRHAQRKAVDISRINGMLMITHYPSDALVKAVVVAIQTRFEELSNKRENFGPAKKLKEGAPHWIAGHNDHIHLSVD